jgi:F0F1-type ATP synthase membrane subunit b/b'
MEEWPMDILQLIDRLEELFNESKAIPLTRNVMVDEDRMLDIIDQMRIAIPEEVKKAQQLLGQRDRVLAQAQEEANRTIEIARQKADQLVTRDMILQEAQRRSEQLLTQARSEADGIRNDADDYVIESLNQLQAELERIANQVRNGIRTVEEEQSRRAPTSTPVSQPVDK